MAIVNGLFTPPLNFDEVAAYFGVATTDAGTLWVTANWNKWAKNKPYLRLKFAPLTEEEKKSNSIDEEVFYGLQAAPANLALDDTMHTATWEYVEKPTATQTYPHRSTDIDNYDHNAVPTIYGVTNIESNPVIYSQAMPFTLELNINPNNTTGVDILGYRSALNGSMSSWYLCVLIGNYASAMLEYSSGAVAPIGSVSGNYKCRALPSQLKTPATNKVTFFLANLDGTSLQEIKDMKTTWVALTQGQRADFAPITIPMAAGLNVEFKDTAIDYGKLTNFTVRYSSSTSLFTIEAEWAVKPSQDRKYIGYFQITNSAGEKSDKVYGTFTGGSEKKDDFFMRIDKSALGIRIDSGTYTYTVEVYGYNNNVESQEAVGTATGTISITI